MNCLVDEFVLSSTCCTRRPSGVQNELTKFCQWSGELDSRDCHTGQLFGPS
jgi:hypothetical protein